LISEVIDKALIIEGGIFDDLPSAKKRLLEILTDRDHGYNRSQFNQEDFTAKLLYDRALIPAESENMTFGGKFQEFMRIVSDLVEDVVRNEDQFEGAFVDAILNPLYLVANRNIRFVRL
jgi:hypothetical protein